MFVREYHAGLGVCDVEEEARISLYMILGNYKEN